MGKVIICKRKLKSVIPFYVKSAEINIYSLEELEYFIYKYIYIIDEEFFSDRIIEFLKNEFEREDIAKVIIQKRNKVSPIILAGEIAILLGGLFKAEIDELRLNIKKYQSLSEIGKIIVKAECFIENGRFDIAFKLCKNVNIEIERGTYKLNKKEEGKLYYIQGKVWLYAFEWDRAIDNMLKSYKLLSQENIIHEVFEIICLREYDIENYAIFSDISEEKKKQWKNRFNEKITKIEQDIANKNLEDVEEKQKQKQKQKEFRIKWEKVM